MELIFEDSISCLNQGIELLETLPAEKLAFRSEDTLGSTIGEHFRHNIDHYRSFLSGASDGHINYDDRARDPRIETDPEFAASCMRAIVGDLQQAAANATSKTLDETVQVKMDSGSETNLWSQSTKRRELKFLLSHTVHHYALIAIICRMIGAPTSPDFGVAPSTQKFREQAGALSH